MYWIVLKCTKLYTKWVNFMVCKLNFNKSVTKKTSIGEKRILSSWKLEVQLPKWKMASLNNETGMVEDQVTNKEKKNGGNL